MGFKESRRRLIQALRDGRFQHEERDLAEGKNLLATAEVTVDFVVAILSRCTGEQYERRPHHWDPKQVVDIYKPTLGGARWYVKAYLVERDGVEAIVISVHPWS